ncbi:MAG: LysE family transporter [Pseudolabrys sp.]|nr:LysE family transporter [Pseudolabrys sp.]MDP2298515.1 LysE family transporter [Pseudolabrys sp.]
MDLVFVLLQLSIMHILMAMIPGPNTVVVTYFSARTSRQAGLKAVAGIVLGSAIWVMLSMMGVGVLLLESGVAYRALRLAGAAYLVYVGVRMLIAGLRPASEQRPAQAARSPMLAGLLTTLSNPKSAVFWTSVFVLVVPAHAPLWFYGAVVMLIVAQSALWYAIVALALSTAFARRHYMRLGAWLDRIAGAIMVGLGLKLANELRLEFFGK